MHMSHNMANFGQLAAEIGTVVWGTPANFNGFRILAALLHAMHDTLVVGISQTLRRWTEGATYIQQDGHHVGHWPTFLVDLVLEALCLMSVALYKRAQILIGDIWACCGGTGYGAFSDIDSITAFADYRVPQLLVWFDVLQYSDSLLRMLHSGKHSTHCFL